MLWRCGHDRRLDQGNNGGCFESGSRYSAAGSLIDRSGGRTAWGARWRAVLTSPLLRKSSQQDGSGRETRQSLDKRNIRLTLADGTAYHKAKSKDSQTVQGLLSDARQSRVRCHRRERERIRDARPRACRQFSPDRGPARWRAEQPASHGYPYCRRAGFSGFARKALVQNIPIPGVSGSCPAAHRNEYIG
jgi:hypothetical protein